MIMEEFLLAFLNWQIIQEAWPILWDGLKSTLALSAMVVPLGIAGGILLAVLSTMPSPWVRWPLRVWVDTFRALPPLVLLIFLFAGLPFAGLDIGAWGAVAVGFFLNTGAYYGEILRAGIESVPRGQIEAARSTGLTSGQTMRHVVLPQAVRNVLPDLISNTLEVVKLTSIASVVALPELLFQARQAQSVTYNATPIVAAAVVYFILLWPVVRLLSRLENRQLASRR
jgi:polar amino acid transport system permease protein